MLKVNLLVIICLGISGCESPPVYIPPAVGTWEGNAFQVVLLGKKHSIRERPKVSDPGHLLVKNENGETVSWRCRTSEVSV